MYLRRSTSNFLTDFVNLLVVGYLLFGVMLLKIHATINKIKDPDKTGDSTYMNPSAFTFSEPMIAINAVAPPGGCKVLVTCIKTMESATAKGAVSQIILGKKV